MRGLAVLIFLPLLVALFTSCVVAVDSANPVPLSSGARSTPGVSSASESPLPFDNPFPNRWNSSNDGTSFEPCTAFSSEDLSALGIDPSVVKDAALVDGQGVRGCNWFMPRTLSLSVVVTNASSLEKYRQGREELAWQENRTIDRRIVGVAKLNDDETICMTFVESMESIVAISVVVTGGSDLVDRYEPCQIVLDFTGKNLEKIPA